MRWFVPMPYVDVTSSWRFETAWSRISVAIAGIYFESWISIFGVFVWYSTDTGTVNHLAHHLVLLAGVSTVLFNANPLMKLDGYYVLSDWIGIPNLYQHGQRRVYGFFERFLLGLETVEPVCSAKRATMIYCYGWLSWMWRVTFCSTLILSFVKWAGESGVWLALILLTAWLGPGVKYSLQLWWKGRPGLLPRRLRAATIVSAMASIVWLMLTFIPWPFCNAAPAIVEDSIPTIVRSTGSGWVEKLHFEVGEFVEAGTVLLTQRNPDLESKVETLRLTIQQSEMRERRARQRNQLAEQQAEVEKRLGLQAELEAKEIELNNLVVIAPHAGNVFHPDPQSLEGRFVKAGEEMISIIDKREKEIRVAVSQYDFQEFSKHQNEAVVVDLPGRELLHGRLARIIPRATLVPLDAALTTVNGGEIPVRPVTGKNRNDSSTEQFELLVPHLEAVVTLDSASSKNLMSGQRGTVYLGRSSKTIGSVLYRMIDQRINDEE